MNNELNKFVSRIINLNITPPGTGASYGGFIGASSMRQHSAEDLKRKTLEFASAYKNKSDDNTLEVLAGEIEGNLLGLNSMAVIDNNILDELLSELHSLKA
jgi:hypothetical protein